MLSSKEWSSKKAKTLLGETVTKALKDVETAGAKLNVKSKQPIEWKDLTAYSGSVKLLQGEIVKTRGKCKKGLHDETMKRLDVMERDAKGLYQDAQKVQLQFNDFLQQFQKAREACVAALEGVLRSQLPKELAKAKQVLEKARDWMQNAEKTFNSAEIEAGMQQMVSGSLIIDKIAKLQAERTPQVAGGRALPATPGELTNELAEVRDQIKKLKTPGGFHNQQFKVQIARSVDMK